MATANINETHPSERRADISTRPPRIIGRTRGRRHGPITRLMSPGDLGELLKPFVFLDLFEMDEISFPGIGLHPHSGIATVTYLFEGSVRYEDSNGTKGILREGGVEWFKRLTERGTVANPATRATPEGSSSGSRCRRTKNSDPWKISTCRLMA